MDFRLINNELDWAKYSQLTCTDKSTLFYQSEKYCHFLQSLLGAEPCYFGAFHDDGTLCAALPGMLSSEGNANGRILNSLPYYGSNGGIVGSKEDKYLLPLYEKFLELGREKNCLSSTLISSPLDSVEMQSWYELNSKYNYKDTRIGQITHLPETSIEFNNFLKHTCNDNVWGAINKARKTGVQVTEGGDDALDFIYTVHSANLADLGGISKDKAFFKLIPKYFKKNTDYKVYIANLNNIPIAGLLLFYFNNTVEYFTPVSLKTMRHIQPLSLIISEAMQDAIKRGFFRWNWGGTWETQKGVYDFKRRWGANDLPYQYYVHIFNPKILEYSKRDLLDSYPFFYALPFDKLQK